MMGWRLAAPVVAAMLAMAAPMAAQDGPAVPIATLDLDRLYIDTDYGRALQARFEAELGVLADENRRIESDLGRRELALTEQRPDLPAEEFRRLADTFNIEVEAHRRAQAAKEEAIYARHNQAQQVLRQAINPVLAGLMAERGILAIISDEAIILAFRQIDLTTEAVARINAELGAGPADGSPADTDGAGPAPTADPATGDGPDADPAPEPTAAPAAD